MFVSQIMFCFCSRVSDYGFNKLIELFEAVPGTVEVTEDPDGERLLQLTDSERLSVVAEQIATLVKNSRRQGCIAFACSKTKRQNQEVSNQNYSAEVSAASKKCGIFLMQLKPRASNWIT